MRCPCCGRCTCCGHDMRPWRWYVWPERPWLELMVPKVYPTPYPMVVRPIEGGVGHAIRKAHEALAA